MIAGEVLAVELEKGGAPAEDYSTAEVTVAGETCAVAMKVV